MRPSPAPNNRDQYVLFLWNIHNLIAKLPFAGLGYIFKLSSTFGSLLLSEKDLHPVATVGCTVHPSNITFENVVASLLATASPAFKTCFCSRLNNCFADLLPIYTVRRNVS
jgi:hypothetical protein